MKKSSGWIKIWGIAIVAVMAIVLRRMILFAAVSIASVVFFVGGLIKADSNRDDYAGEYPDPTSAADFSLAEIEVLKRINDWNHEVDIEKCVKVSIIRNEAEGPVEKTVLKSFYNDALDRDAANNPWTAFLLSDDYGRSIYLATGNYSTDRYVVLLFDSNQSYDREKGVMELTEWQNYQDELKAFKELNNWNQPFDTK